MPLCPALDLPALIDPREVTIAFEQRAGLRTESQGPYPGRGPPRQYGPGRGCRGRRPDHWPLERSGGLPGRSKSGLRRCLARCRRTGNKAQGQGCSCLGQSHSYERSEPMDEQAQCLGRSRATPRSTGQQDAAQAILAGADDGRSVAEPRSVFTESQRLLIVALGRLDVTALQLNPGQPLDILRHTDHIVNQLGQPDGLASIRLGADVIAEERPGAANRSERLGPTMIIMPPIADLQTPLEQRDCTGETGPFV